MDYTKEDVCVGPSRNGLGLFSLRTFAAGDFVGPIEGEIMADPEYGSEYAMELGERALEPAAPFRFVNHSCRPNCALALFDEEAADGTVRPAHVWLEILSEIALGQQMTIDYAWPAGEAIPCQCGAASCRGWIVAEEQLGEAASARRGSAAAN